VEVWSHLTKKLPSKTIIEGKIKGEIEVTRRRDRRLSSYWMTLRTGEDTRIWRRKLYIALCGGTVLEEALDLSSNKLLNEVEVAYTDSIMFDECICT